MSLPAAHKSHVKNLFRQIQIHVPQHPATQKKGRRGKAAAPPPPQPHESKAKPYKKKPIPVAIREATWILRCGRVFEHKCLTTWCPNTLTVFDFQAGHDIPESKGGATKPENLYPICARCNGSMGNRYTFQEWCAIQSSPAGPPPPPPPPKEVRQRRGWRRFFSCW